MKTYPKFKYSLILVISAKQDSASDQQCFSVSRHFTSVATEKGAIEQINSLNIAFEAFIRVREALKKPI